MGFLRFRRTIRLAPWLRMNVSKTGLSTSIGKRGATINIRGDRVRGTVGVPGTGLSYSEQSTQRTGSGTRALALLVLVALVLVAAYLLGWIWQGN